MDKITITSNNSTGTKEKAKKQNLGTGNEVTVTTIPRYSNNNHNRVVHQGPRTEGQVVPVDKALGTVVAAGTARRVVVHLDLGDMILENTIKGHAYG